MLNFEDFTPGRRFNYGAYRVTEDEVIAFAREFDPQRFHLDTSTPGGVIASGWHTCAMNMRMTTDALMGDSTSAGAPGLDEVQWLRPVRSGMVLSVGLDIVGARVSRSRPDLGLVSLVFTIADQTGEPVMRQRNWSMFGRRDANAPFPADESPAPARANEVAEPPTSDDVAVNRTRFATTYEDAVVGARVSLGKYEFKREDMLRFAAAYDPQPFHLDDAAAARSHFGKLAASGWHTAAAYMRCFVDTRDRMRAEALASGEDGSSGRPSPGFNDLRWVRPVFVDDVVSFETTITGKRPSSSAGWGKLFTRARGYEQSGKLVFEQRGTALARMRG
jgi:acyl dehydratase